MSSSCRHLRSLSNSNKDEMTNLISQHRHLFIDQLALQPCNPTFLQARDAWIQADVNRFAGANECLLWNVRILNCTSISLAKLETDEEVWSWFIGLRWTRTGSQCRKPPEWRYGTRWVLNVSLNLFTYMHTCIFTYYSALTGTFSFAPCWSIALSLFVRYVLQSLDIGHSAGLFLNWYLGKGL